MDIEKVDVQAEVSLHVLDEMLTGVPDVGVRLWDGQMWGSPEPKVTLVLQHPGALREMLLSGTELGMAESYLYDDIDIVGNIELIFDLSDELTQKFSVVERLGIGRELMKLPKGHASNRGVHAQANRDRVKLSGRRHSIERDRQAVRYHYDVSNDFYSLYLDQRMVYSCAYFRSPDGDLDLAQEDKLDMICRKMRLKPGQKLLDLGCGWGGLIIHAAQHYGVDATGITLSQPQADLANERIRAAGLEDRCRARVQDYRELDGEEVYDAISSVGMFEHVGEKLLPEYFERAHRLLRKGGVFLNHGIAQSLVPLAGDANGAKARRQAVEDKNSFSNAYVFPDGELVPVNLPLQVAEDTGFEVRDVESLREHYVITLRNWVRRLEEHHEQALKYVDEATYRVWRLYMSGSAYRFRKHYLNIYQSLLSKPYDDGSSHLPLRREDWYAVPV